MRAARLDAQWLSGRVDGAWCTGEGLASRKPRLLETVRDAIRMRHYSRRTERAYLAWIRRYILFHGKRHPKDMGAEEVSRFLSSLAVEGRVSASTQNQALSALLFLYRSVLGVDLPWLTDLVRAARPQRLPVVLSRDEVRAAPELQVWRGHWFARYPVERRQANMLRGRAGQKREDSEMTGSSQTKRINVPGISLQRRAVLWRYTELSKTR